MQISLITPTVSLPRVLNKDYACQSFRCGCLLVCVCVRVCVCSDGTCLFLDNKKVKELLTEST